jgi:hypothetical protein
MDTVCSVSYRVSAWIGVSPNVQYTSDGMKALWLYKFNANHCQTFSTFKNGNREFAKNGWKFLKMGSMDVERELRTFP